MAVHRWSRRGMTELSTTATESLYQYVPDSTPSHPVDFRGLPGDSVSVDPCDSMGQSDAKLMLSTSWWGQLARLSERRDTLGTKIAIAAPPARSTKHDTSYVRKTRTLITNGNQFPFLAQSCRSRTSTRRKLQQFGAYCSGT